MTLTRRPAPFAPLGLTPPATAGHPPRLLVVCTGNICRSAYAHHGLQARLDAALGAGAVEVSSAGTGVNPALAVPEEVLALTADAGTRQALAAHRPTQLTRRVLQGQDMILAATDAHLDVVLREDPTALRRSFTVLEAARLAAEAGEDLVDPGSGLASLAAGLDRARGRGRRRPEDLADPFRGPAEGYAAMARSLDPALDVLGTAVARAVGV